MQTVLYITNVLILTWTIALDIRMTRTLETVERRERLRHAAQAHVNVHNIHEGSRHDSA